MDLVVEVYKATRCFPREEQYGLSSQLRRAVVSVPSNIAEGQGRWSEREFTHSLSIAHGSLREVEAQLLIAERLGYIDSERRAAIMAMASESGRLINGLANSPSQ